MRLKRKKEKKKKKIVHPWLCIWWWWHLWWGSIAHLVHAESLFFRALSFVFRERAFQCSLPSQGRGLFQASSSLLTCTFEFSRRSLSVCALLKSPSCSCAAKNKQDQTFFWNFAKAFGKTMRLHQIVQSLKLWRLTKASTPLHSFLLFLLFACGWKCIFAQTSNWSSFWTSSRLPWCSMCFHFKE